MAGGKLYLSQMLTDLQTKINTMVTAMSAQTTALSNIYAAASGGVSKLIVKAGVSHTTPFVSSDTDFAPNQGQKLVGVLRKSFCDGSVRISGVIECTTTTTSSRTSSIAYSTDGGTTKTTIATFSQCEIGTIVSQVGLTIPITSSSVIGFYMTTDYNVTMRIKAGFGLTYDIADLVNNSAFIPLS